MKAQNDSPSMHDHWSHLRDVQGRDAAPGLAIFRDVDVIDGWGYLSRNGTQIIKGGEGLGWAHEHLQQIVDKFHGSEVSQLPEVGGSSSKTDVLLSFPGAYTYGHWPIDILARIEQAVQFFDVNDLNFIVPGPLPAYSDFFLQAYGIDRGALIAIPDRHRYRSRTLVVPYIRKSDYLPPDPFGRSFMRLKAHGYKFIDDNMRRGERLFVAHRPQTSAGQRPTLSNADEIEAALLPFGFERICPADMSIPEQVSAFSGAKCIVGEDSSALHNIIFSDTVTLIVLNAANRKNLLHHSICQLLGHTCEYLFCDADGAGFACEPDRVGALLAGSKPNSNF